MRKTVIILVIILILASFSGCASDDFGAYMSAMSASESIQSGREYFELELEIDYNKEGLSDDDLKVLSYFDVIRYIMNDQFEHDEEGLHVASDVYYNLGGMGLDMKLYIDGNQMYMKMPVSDEYIDLSEELITDETGMNEEGQQFMEVFEPLVEAWKEVLNDEDIVQGENTYILTESGQLKATTYDITIDKEQLEYLSDVLINEITKEDIAEYFISQNSEDLTTEEIEEVAETFQASLSNAEIIYFNATAFVDFDGRMVRQTFDFEIDFGQVDSGQMQYVKGSMTMETTEIDEPQNIVYPTISPDQWIENDADSNFYEGLFPEDLFED